MKIFLDKMKHLDLSGEYTGESFIDRHIMLALASFIFVLFSTPVLIAAFLLDPQSNAAYFVFFVALVIVPGGATIVTLGKIGEAVSSRKKK